MTGRLENKNVILIGGTKGIGLGIAKVFAQEGASLLVCSRSTENLKRTHRQLKDEFNIDINIFNVDISDEESIKTLTKHANTLFNNKIDVLCQNAGMFPKALIKNMSLFEWNEVINTNLTGTFLAIKHIIPSMIKNKYGRIVITSSITGPKVSSSKLSHYSASKSGINGFVKAAAIEFAIHNITINCVEPGNILTEGLEELGQEYLDTQIKAVPLGCFGTPEDIGKATLFLASDEAKYITGQSIVVDGGQVLPESHFNLNCQD